MSMQVRIEKLIYGGAGLARTDQGVVFVERVLAGELVEVEIIEPRKDYSLARLIEVLEPSEARRSPACPNFETVGCCDWAHIRHPDQIRIKEAVLRESLQRLGHLDRDEPIHTIPGPDGGYRIRAIFHVIDCRPGFVREGTHEVVPITGCPSLMPELNEFIGQATAALGEGRFQGADAIRVVASPTTCEVAAVFMRGREKARWTSGSVLTEVGGFQYRLHPMGFFQPNRYMLLPLQSRVAELVPPARVVLDLFSGDGFFSLPLARKAEQVVAVDRRSTANAMRNARLNRVGNITFVKSSARAFLMNAAIRPDAVVLDPPRSGGGPNLTRRIAGLGPARIVYVSCNPTTFAADARVLASHDYRITHLEILDQFPNTHHIETIALFEK